MTVTLPEIRTRESEPMFHLKVNISMTVPSSMVTKLWSPYVTSSVKITLPLRLCTSAVSAD